MIFAAAIIVSFILGFWFGHYSVSPEIIIADDSYADSEPTVEENPSNLDLYLSNKVENAKPENAKPAVSQSVDDNKPVTKPAPKPKPAPVVVARPAPPVVAPPSPPPLPSRPVIKPPPLVKPVTPVNVAPPAVINKPVTVPVDIAPEVAEPVADESAATSESITNSSLSAADSNTQYTVQAGAFDNRDNAMKLVAELNIKGFDAYTAESINSSGDLKFNVRFSRHSERNFVQKRLARFKQLYTTSAYIIVVDQ